MMYTPSIIFEEDLKLKIVDQTLLPHKLQYIYIKTIEEAVTAIKQLKVRGAPAIGIVAAYVLYILADQTKNFSVSQFREKMIQFSETLKNTRPTAVNLGWAIQRIRHIFLNENFTTSDEIVTIIKQEALKIHEEDRQACQQIGHNGLELISDSCNILTHCNTGSLATGGWGTALGVVYAAQEKRKKIHVFIDETRPLGQGARLTFWELNQANIPCTLITDSAAASLMAKNKVDIIIFGADRIAANGDVANKIGSYNLAVLANYHHVPCYSAAPLSTFDLSISNGSEIPIENRRAEELLDVYNYNAIMNKKQNVYNPAFDVTPAELLAGIITEKGILRQPMEKSISSAFA